MLNLSQIDEKLTSYVRVARFLKPNFFFVSLMFLSAWITSKFVRKVWFLFILEGKYDFFWFLQIMN